MKQVKSFLAEVIKVHSSYKIIKAYANQEDKNACVIPIHDVKQEGHPSLIDPVEKAKSEAENILAEAEYNARQIKDDAIQKAQIDAQVMIDELKKLTYDEAYKQGYEEGQAEGYNQGQEEGQKQADITRKQAKFVLQNAQKMSQDSIDKHEIEIIDLAIHIARKVLLKTISDQDEHLLFIAQDACSELKNKSQIIIRVHPVNSTLFISQVEVFKEICPNTVFSVLEDEGIDETGCVLETDTQVINTQITSQLENIKEALLEMVKKNDQ